MTALQQQKTHPWERRALLEATASPATLELLKAYPGLLIKWWHTATRHWPRRRSKLLPKSTNPLCGLDGEAAAVAHNADLLNPDMVCVGGGGLGHLPSLNKLLSNRQAIYWRIGLGWIWA